MTYTIEPKIGKAYDVVVCGGGTAGCAAAIAAAREGASVLMLERTFTVGGMLTMGDAGITKFTEHCKDADIYKKEVLDVLSTEPEKVQVVRGIPHEYCMRMLKAGGALGTSGECGSYVFTDRYCAQLTLIDMLKESGAEVLYDSVVCLVKKDGDAVRSVVVYNKEGFTEYPAKCVIDCTGDADAAALAGVEFVLGASEADYAEGGAREIGQLQVAGTMYRVTGVDFEKVFAYLEAHPERFKMQSYGIMTLENVKESHRRGEMSVFSIWMGEHPGKDGFVQVYNLPAPETDGAILLAWNVAEDCNNNCECCGIDAWSLSASQDHLLRSAVKFTDVLRESCPGFEQARVVHIPDVGVRETRHIVGRYKLSTMDVAIGRDFEDSIACGGHPVDISPRPPEIANMDMNHWRFHIPYRVMIPEKVENLLVAGRPISASRAASGAVRPTVQCMALGEAAGVAAAMAAKGGVTPADVDVKALRDTLVKNGAII